ncbi:MAG: SIMPL domain-containing protein [Pseudomonadota bacterium]
MTRRLALIAVIATLALAPLAALAQGLPSYPFVHVNASAVTEVIPDSGEVDFEIAVSDADAARALATVEERLVEIRAILASAGIPDADFDIRDVRRDIKKGEPGAAPIYDYRCGVKIVVRNLANWRSVLEPLLAKPNLDSFITAFDTTQRDKVESELMATAVKKATRKAEALAGGFGRKLGAVTALTSGELKNLTRALNLASTEFRGSGGQQVRRDKTELLMITSIKMGQPVDVIFKLK